MRLVPDARLVRLAAAGSTAALTAIYERHHQEIYRYCRSILHSDDDARDALQNTMLKAMRALEGESREISLRPWLFRIAHNEAVSLVRRRRPDTPLELAGELADGGTDLDARQRLRSLIEDLEQLAPRQKSALVMRELSGLEFAEIGAALETSPAAAKQAVYEARVALHELEDGREMDCDDVREKLSAEDRRLLRARRIRAHLKGCDDCRAFKDAIYSRRGQLAALAPPLPLPIALHLLEGILGGGGGSGGAGAAVGLAGGGAATGLGAGAVAKLGVTGLIALGAGAAAIETIRSGAGSPWERATAPAVGADSQDLARSPSELSEGVANGGTRRAEDDGRASTRSGAGGRANGSGLAVASADAGGSGAGGPANGSGVAVASADASAENTAGSAQGLAGPDQPAAVDDPPPSAVAPPSAAEDTEPPAASADDSGGGPPASAGPAGLPPGHGGTPPGQGGTPPGLGAPAPGQGGTPPGQSVAPATTEDVPPGHGGTPPGQAATASDQRR